MENNQQCDFLDSVKLSQRLV